MQPVASRPRQFLVETFVPGADRRAVEAAASRARVAADDLRVTGLAIEYLGAIHIPSDEVVLHLFRADTSDLVRAAGERAQVGCERVTEAVTIDGGDASGPGATGPVGRMDRP